MSQQEIEMPRQPKAKTIFCSCRGGKCVTVVLEKSVSPEYLTGKCPSCNKIHAEKAV